MTVASPEKSKSLQTGKIKKIMEKQVMTMLQTINNNNNNNNNKIIE